MRPGLFLCVLAAGCAVEGPPSERGQLRQAFPMTPMAPVQLGRSVEAQLGSSVAGCRVPGFVAGAPGESATFLFLDGGTWLEAPIPGPWDAGGVGVAVGCEGPPTAIRVLTSGHLGAWSLRVGGSSQLLAGGPVVEEIERGPLSTTPLLLGQPSSGTVRLELPTTTGYFPLSDVSEAPGAGAALVWDPTGDSFAVGDPSAHLARVYLWVSDGGLGGWTFDAGDVVGPAGTDFGAALAVADVHPNPGLELIVGSPSSAQVFIYSEVSGLASLLLVLEPAGGVSGSFGISLAIEPTPIAGGTLHALWVGDPVNERVFRFVGDAGQAFTSASFGEEYFGFSLAVSEQNLIIGAPLHSEVLDNAGAVYSVPFDTAVIPSGVPMSCDASRVCVTPGCQIGRCLGGVVCQAMGNPLCSAQVCNNGACDGGFVPVDAGRPDAGGPDAGLPDAGEPDAGKADGGSVVPDGGEADAGKPPRPDAGGGVDAGEGGVEIYGTSCGCSGAGAIPLVLLSMALSRRARRLRLRGR